MHEEKLSRKKGSKLPRYLFRYLAKILASDLCAPFSPPVQCREIKERKNAKTKQSMVHLLQEQERHVRDSVRSPPACTKVQKRAGAEAGLLFTCVVVPPSCHLLTCVIKTTNERHLWPKISDICA